jgi:PQQ-dependent catabolism-associated CXXCW motif protein
LPETGRGALPPALEAKFRARVASLTGGDLARPIAVYCLSHCWMSWNAAKRLVAYGYRHVLWYPDGADGWAAAGLPVEVAKEE